MSRASERRKTDDDRRFLARVGTADVTRLRQMLREHFDAAHWKRIAIQRAIARGGRKA